MAQEIVHLSRDPGPFLGSGGSGGQRAGLFQIGIAFPQQADQGPPLPQQGSGQGGEQYEQQR